MSRRMDRVALAMVVPVVLALAAPPYAAATGTGESTTGTASTVSPSTVAVGGTLTYTLSGFPPRAVVRVVVDDGALVATGDASVGSVVTGEDGVATGRIELPGYVSKGSHWLRFNVTAGPDVPTSETRTLDYTNKSPAFTVSDVTVIGGTGAAVGPAATTPAPATGRNTGSGRDEGAATPGVSGTNRFNSAGVQQPSGRPSADIGSGVLAGGGRLVLLGLLLVVPVVLAVVIRRRTSRPRRAGRHLRR